MIFRRVLWLSQWPEVNVSDTFGSARSSLRQMLENRHISPCSVVSEGNFSHLLMDLLNFWRIFKSWKLGIVVNVMRSLREILHIIQLIGFKRGTGMEKDSNSQHTRNWGPGFIFQCLVNFWKLDIGHICPCYEVFVELFYTLFNRLASDVAQTCNWVVVPCLPEN